jgi:hypothetical protein
MSTPSDRPATIPTWSPVYDVAIACIVVVVVAAAIVAVGMGVIVPRLPDRITLTAEEAGTYLVLAAVGGMATAYVLTQTISGIARRQISAKARAAIRAGATS